MALDVNTLFLVTIYVEAMLGLLLLFAWVQNSGIHAVAWWGCAHLLRAASIVLFGMYGSVSDAISIDLANAILFTAFALTWSGARVFNGRAPEPMYIVGGAILWILLTHTSSLFESLDAKVLLASGIICAYTWATAYEFWHGRGEPLVSRWPAIFMLFAHGALFLLRTPLAQVLPWSPSSQVFDSVWLTVLSFEALLFTIAIAFILLAMAKERTEMRHKTAALIDPLTGIANRRAFLEDVMVMAKRQQVEHRPAAVLLADLDHFKSINDRFGHAVGDRVLQIFAATACSKLSSADLIGRLGGEEFVIVVYDAGRDQGLAIAERIRMAFEDTASDVEGRSVGGTVSMGVAIADMNLFDIPALLQQSDEALYCAKERGRNRVEVASLQMVLDRANEAEAEAGHATPRVAANAA
ncbi:MAG: GGDEF domain-containing protein [Alphaproteobacteria bacterium]|nr:GGDEF domain-containing protein [Alphaproteobacteria bacterium]